jgi:hypothetical protein
MYHIPRILIGRTIPNIQDDAEFEEVSECLHTLHALHFGGDSCYTSWYLHYMLLFTCRLREALTL